MKRKAILLFLTFCLYILPTQQTLAGPLYALCCFACGATCGSTGFFAPFCLMACVSGCTVACFDKNTTFLVLENGEEIEKNISIVKVGDMVRTLHDGKLVWTKVLRCINTAGNFDFIQLNFQNVIGGNQKQLSVTTTHGMILLSENNFLTLTPAKDLTVGDKVISSEGDVLVITEINKAMMEDKYTLETSDGTVIASGIFVSTLCEEEINNGKQLYDTKMIDWHNRHDKLISDIS